MIKRTENVRGGGLSSEVGDLKSEVGERRSPRNLPPPI